MLSNNHYSDLMESMFEVISKKYSYLVIRKEEFEKTKSVFESEIMSIHNNTGFLKLSMKALSELKDSHIRLIDGMGTCRQTYSKIAEKNYDNDTLEKYLSSVEKNGPVTLAKINDMVYVRINDFLGRNKKSFDWLYNHDPIEQKFIIDLRDNGGGDDSLGMPLVNFILGESKDLVSCYYRERISEFDPLLFSDFQPRYIQSDYSSQRKNAVVLIGKNTCSAAELITMDLAAIPNVLLMGDVTGGLSGRPQRYLIGHSDIKIIGFKERPLNYDAKFAIDLPSRLVYTFDKILVQDNGINPHLHIPSNKSIINGRDIVLEEAILTLKD